MAFKRPTAVCVAIALATASVPASALATKPSLAAAKAAAAAQARSLARQTHASSSRVIACHRSTSVRYLCQVENRFSSGAKRCTADVLVRFVKGRARTSYSNYVCY